MPRHDDVVGIPNHSVLIRAVQPDWLEVENGHERLRSSTYLDGQQEASCFISAEVGDLEGFRANILPTLARELGVQIAAVATIPVAEVRAEGLWVYRKPEEFHNNPAHVVVCPPDGITKSQYAKRAKRLAPLAAKHPVLER